HRRIQFFESGIGGIISGLLGGSFVKSRKLSLQSVHPAVDLLQRIEISQLFLHRFSCSFRQCVSAALVRQQRAKNLHFAFLRFSFASTLGYNSPQQGSTLSLATEGVALMTLDTVSLSGD